MGVEKDTATYLTSGDFLLFKRLCRDWQILFNCQDYRLIFEFVSEDSGNWADTETTENKLAYIRLFRKIDAKDLSDFPGIEYLARHEMLHVLLSKMTLLVPDKVEHTKEFGMAEESVVVIFENLLEKANPDLVSV